MAWHPCGAVMDVIRTCYRVKMRTTTEAAPVEVQWYFTNPGAPVFTGPTVFRSRMWKDIADFPNTGMGEQTEVCANRKVVDYSNGAEPPGLTTGLEPCGSDDVARDGGGPTDPIFATRLDGGAPCCLGPPAFTTHIGHNVGMDGTFHGIGDYPADGVFVLLLYTWDGGGSSAGAMAGGGVVQFDFPHEGATTLTVVFSPIPNPTVVNVSADASITFSEIVTWGVRYLQFRIKFTVSGTMYNFTMQWV